jgi:hypothetical protein
MFFDSSAQEFHSKFSVTNQFLIVKCGVFFQVRTKFLNTIYRSINYLSEAQSNATI